MKIFGMKLNSRQMIFICVVLIYCIGICIKNFEEIQQVLSLSETRETIIKKINIMQKDGKVELYPQIEIMCSKKLKYGYVTLEGVTGNTQIKDNKIIYRPNEILQPKRNYNMSIEYQGKNDEDILIQTHSFITKELEDDIIWVEVSLTNKYHKVYIRKGKTTIIKEMLCSGGTKDQPTLMGTFYLKDRGNSFYSERFKEGALYWVRFKDQYLFHSVPRDKEGNIIPKEADKIGKPASHGCIRLVDEDAKWFYNNILDETMVIIHD